VILASYEMGLFDRCTIVCPLCGSSMEGMGHAATSGCPHVVATVVFAGDPESIHWEDLGCGQELEALIGEKIECRRLLQEEGEEALLVGAMMDLWESVSLLYGETVLLEIWLRMDHPSRWVLSQGLFAFDNSLQAEEFCQALQVKVASADQHWLVALFPREVLLLALAIPLWLFSELAPGLHGRFVRWMDAWIMRRVARLERTS
jgi:hypothetical protein